MKSKLNYRKFLFSVPIRSTLDRAYEIFQFHSIVYCCPQELSPCSLSLVSNYGERRAGGVMMHGSYLLVQIAYSALSHTPSSLCFIRQLFLIQFKRVRSFPTLLYVHSVARAIVAMYGDLIIKRKFIFHPNDD